MQINSMDEHLRTGIWNTFYTNIYEDIRNYNGYWVGHLEYIPKHIWTEFLKKDIAEFPSLASKFMYEMKYYFMKENWNKIFDLVELCISVLSNSNENRREKFVNECNRILERESSGYRIINKIVTPITNNLEINEIKESINANSKNIAIHIQTAIEKLSDRNNPDFRNSIKESISAVETICREITGENTLGKAITKLESTGIIINNQFKEGLEKFYAYTNSKNTGIRHSLLDSKETPSFDEAKFFLVICSAFVNYINSQKIKLDILK